MFRYGWVLYVALVPYVLGQGATAGSKPHIITILQDDLGFYDAGFTGNKNAVGYSHNITHLAQEGITLHNHYTHWHCSPTRRSFLTGRLPIHHGEQLSGNDSDDIDLRMTWISAKLKSAGYTTHWFGKWHTGFESMNHLGLHNGFDNTFGSLETGGAYSGPKHTTRWQNDHPFYKDSQITNPPPGCKDAPDGEAGTACSNEYSTNLWGQGALQAVAEHTTGPLYIHLCFQAVHTPYDKAPGDPTGNVYHGMLWDADVFIGKLVNALKAKGMWNNTLIVYSADNGGVGDGINYPLRGEKHSNWEGGMRTAAFVSGGAVPPALRGTTNNVTCHIVDWYPTLCSLAGVSAADGPATPPLPVDPAHPHKNIYGDDSYPAIDGTNLWPFLVNPDQQHYGDAHQYLVLTKEVLISKQYKLLVSQPHFKSQNNGWKQPDGTWLPANNDDCIAQDGPPSGSAFPVPKVGGQPCLFDVRADPSERHNIAAAHPEIVAELWGVLNRTVLTTRDCSGWTYKPIPGPNGQCSPAKLLGKCDKSCAKSHWQTYGQGTGPICGVPGC